MQSLWILLFPRLSFKLKFNLIIEEIPPPPNQRDSGQPQPIFYKCCSGLSKLLNHVCQVFMTLNVRKL